MALLDALLMDLVVVVYVADGAPTPNSGSNSVAEMPLQNMNIPIGQAKQDRNLVTHLELKRYNALKSFSELRKILDQKVQKVFNTKDQSHQISSFPGNDQLGTGRASFIMNREYVKNASLPSEIVNDNVIWIPETVDDTVSVPPEIDQGDNELQASNINNEVPHSNVALDEMHHSIIHDSSQNVNEHDSFIETNNQTNRVTVAAASVTRRETDSNNKVVVLTKREAFESTHTAYSIERKQPVSENDTKNNAKENRNRQTNATPTTQTTKNDSLTTITPSNAKTSKTTSASKTLISSTTVKTTVSANQGTRVKTHFNRISVGGPHIQTRTLQTNVVSSKIDKVRKGYQVQRTADKNWTNDNIPSKTDKFGTNGLVSSAVEKVGTDHLVSSIVDKVGPNYLVIVLSPGEMLPSDKTVKSDSKLLQAIYSQLDKKKATTADHDIVYNDHRAGQLTDHVNDGPVISNPHSFSTSKRQTTSLKRFLLHKFKGFPSHMASLNKNENTDAARIYKTSGSNPSLHPSVKVGKQALGGILAISNKQMIPRKGRKSRKEVLISQTSSQGYEDNSAKEDDISSEET